MSAIESFHTTCSKLQLSSACISYCSHCCWFWAVVCAQMELLRSQKPSSWIRKGMETSSRFKLPLIQFLTAIKNGFKFMLSKGYTGYWIFSFFLSFSLSFFFSLLQYVSPTCRLFSSCFYVLYAYMTLKELVKLYLMCIAMVSSIDLLYI